MNTQQFEHSLEEDAPPPGLTPALGALWQDGKGDWSGAHARLKDQNDAESAWVHAYLHRKEGDMGNAGYWYRRAGQPMFTGTLADEWRHIAGALLAQSGADRAG